LSAVLEVSGLTRRFGGLAALDGFELAVAPGEILGIIGPNGAGKSVLINLVTRFYPPSSGRILYCGRDITTLGATAVGRLGIARTFQNIRLFRRMTVLENVMAANPRHARAPLRSVFGRGRAADVTAATRLLALMHITPAADRLAGTLAYGDARRLEIARALATEPKLLLLDEPAAGMNEEETARLVEDIRAAAREVDAIVLIEHDMALIRALSTRVVAMNAGRKVTEGAVADVLAHPEVVRAYLGAIAEEAAA
jgi:branched-chain amino acid transport system ATP-binding protein